MTCRTAPGLRCATALLLLAPGAAALQEPATSLPPVEGRWCLLSPSGKELALAATDGSILILDIEQGRLRVRIPDHLGLQIAGREPKLSDWAWSPSGQLFARLFSNGRVLIANTADGSLRAELATPLAEDGGPFARWIYLPGDDRLVVGFGGVPTEIWSVTESRRVAKIAASAGPITALAFSKDRELLALSDAAGNVSIWNTRTGESTGKRLEVGARVECMAFHPEGSQLAIGTRDCDVRLWSFDQGNEIRRLSHCDADIFGSLRIGCVTFSPDGTRLVSTSGDYWEARLWNLADHRELWRYSYEGGNAGSLGADFSADGTRVLLGLRGVVVDSASGKVLTVLAPTGELRPWFASDGRLAWTIHEGCLRVFSLAGDCEPLLELALDVRYDN